MRTAGFVSPGLAHRGSHASLRHDSRPSRSRLRSRSRAHRRPPASSLRPSRAMIAFLDTVQTRTFDCFWETANPQNGLVPDRWPTTVVLERRRGRLRAHRAIPSASSAAGSRATRRASACSRRCASSGTRRRARRRRASPAIRGSSTTSSTWRRALASSTSSSPRSTPRCSSPACFLPRVLRPRRRRRGRGPRARRLALPARRLALGVATAAASSRWAGIPRRGFHHLDWSGYNEAMLLYVLALGSPTHPIDPTAWTAWT